MKKRLLSVFYAFLAAVLCTTSVLAGGSVKLSAAPTFSLGSLIAQGTFIGLGKSGTYVVVLDASGPADITCTNGGSNDVPGQSSPKISASGHENLNGDNGFFKNGKSPFDVETVDPTTLMWDVAGCPNSNWTGRVDFIYWKNATISVYDTATKALLFKQDYTCTTTRYPAAVSCTAVP